MKVHDEDELAIPADEPGRQKLMISLLYSVRALALSIVFLFLVFGVCGVVLLSSINDTRATTREMARQQNAVLCDFYSRYESDPPVALECP